MDKINLGWDQVRKRAYNIMTKELMKMDYNPKIPFLRLYGIPCGGIHACTSVFAVLQKENIASTLVENPNEADVFIDDIIDTGKTRKKFLSQYIHTPFFALIDRRGKDREIKGWVVFPWERMENRTEPVENIRRILEYIGEDPKREGLQETPERVLRSYEKLFGGYKLEPANVIKTFENNNYDEMVLMKDIEFYSTCEHHMLPFYGKAHIAYIPNGKIIGASKLARLLEIYARRLQIQERLCQQITEVLDGTIKPKGSACIIEAQHFCMTARGVEKQSSIMVTSSLTGSFQNVERTRNELMKMIGK